MALGYRLFRCRPCRRTGTPFNHLQVPTDSALLVVLWRLRYKRSLRDLAEMFLTRGFGSFAAAARFCFAHDELRDYLRARTRTNETVALAEQRRLFQVRWGAVLRAA